MRAFLLLLLLTLVIAACQPADTTPPALPTAFVLPSPTPTDEPTATSTVTPTPSSTPTSTDTPTRTATPTATPLPSDTPTLRATVNPTAVVIGTATAAVEERPVFATLTPEPGGGSVPGTPAVMAAVVITERQFQEALNLKIQGNPAIEQALVDFVRNGISIQLTALGGGAFTTGTLFIPVEPSQEVVTFQGQLTFDENAPEPPAEFIQFATGDFFILVIQTLDEILKERLGSEQDLRSIIVTDRAIEISLLVPQP